MKKKIFSFSLLVLLLTLGVGCATSVATNNFDEIPSNIVIRSGESLVTIQRKGAMAGAAIGMRVWIDGERVAEGIKNGEKTHIVIPNGTHEIQAGSSELDKGSVINITVNDEEIFLFAEPALGVLAARFKLSETGRRGINQ